MNTNLKKEGNYLYQVRTRTGKPIRKLLGIKCPYCGYFAKENKNYEDWAVDATEHITYCSPAHKRAEMGERL